jgi:hypothetical protein
MKSILQNIASLLIAGAVLLVGWASFATEKANLAGVSTTKCSVSTDTVKTIGNQLSSTILSANGTRAWAKIQMPSNATNTAAFSFDEGAAATLSSGTLLGQVNATTTTNEITFGLSTPFPYTGAITGLTNLGSTTVHVVECVF